MHDALYHLLVGVLDLFLWGGELMGEENLPEDGPAVFIANHLDAAGPIACCCSLPMRLHPWSIGDMMDREKAAAYLNMDFTERQLHLKPPLSLWLSRLLSRITVPMFWSLGCIPVYKGDYERMKETLLLSMKVLRQGKFLLIFPEEPLLGKDEETGMSPFQHTFARLGEMYYTETGKRLQFYPVAVHAKGVVQVGRPVSFNPVNAAGMERQRLKTVMESEVRSMYMQLCGQTAKVAGLTPQRK